MTKTISGKYKSAAVKDALGDLAKALSSAHNSGALRIIKLTQGVSETSPFLGFIRWIIVCWQSIGKHDNWIFRPSSGEMPEILFEVSAQSINGRSPVGDAIIDALTASIAVGARYRLQAIPIYVEGRLAMRYFLRLEQSLNNMHAAGQLRDLKMLTNQLLMISSSERA
jgi:hypothetical protein